MDDISINGEKYVKASLIARELGYTSDYVGQLCRGGKVDAQLVGRSWYVREESLREHKKDRYRSSTKKTKKAVEEAVQESTQKAARVKSEHNFPSQITKATSFPRPNYEADYHELLPKLTERNNEENTHSAREDVPENAISNEIVGTVDNSDSSTKEVRRAPSNQVQSIPINVIDSPVPSKRDQITDIQHKDSPNSESLKKDTQEEDLTPDKYNVLLWGLMLVIASIVAVALVGLEANVFAQQGSVSSTYTFDLGKVLQLPANLLK